jgi:hypothetical protein
MGIIIGRNWRLTSPRERTINACRLAQADAEVLIRDFGAEEYDAAQKAGGDCGGTSERPAGIVSRRLWPTWAYIKGHL